MTATAPSSVVRFNIQKDGFYGVFHPYVCPHTGQISDSAVIYMLGPDVDGIMVKMGLKWLHAHACSVMVIAPPAEEKGFHSIPLERFGMAIDWMKAHGLARIGIAGGSATAMLALLVASYYSDITLTLAMTPCDFVMEGYYRDNLDGTKERPSDGESFATWRGENIPYLPYAYRHPEYWNRVMAESKASKNMIATRKMFEESEQRHPLKEDEFIKVENIQGTLVLAGARDDALWDTVKYINRMVERLHEHGSSARVITCIYDHGTHFTFPQSMLQNTLHCLSGLPALLFAAGRRYPKECKQSRVDFDAVVSRVIKDWLQS